MAQRLPDAETRAWQALLHAHYEVTRQLDRELRHEHGLSLEAYDILLRLAHAEDHALTMTELAKRVLAPSSTLTRRVDRLVELGFVSRSRPDRDSRVVSASLTPAGLGRLRRAARTHLRGIRKHFTGRLSERQLQAVADALEVIVGAHQPH
jgi:DNA-binding MarR family transcriptional regulator